MQALHRAPFVLTAVFTESTASVKYERWGQENVDCGQNQPTPNSEPSDPRLEASRLSGHRSRRWSSPCETGAAVVRLGSSVPAFAIARTANHHDHFTTHVSSCQNQSPQGRVEIVIVFECSARQAAKAQIRTHSDLPATRRHASQEQTSSNHVILYCDVASSFPSPSLKAEHRARSTDDAVQYRRCATCHCLISMLLYGWL